MAPVFTITASDAHAVALLRSLADAQEAAGLDVADVRAHADQMAAWQEQHGIVAMPLPWFEHVRYQYDAGDTFLHWLQRKVFRLLGRESGVLWKDSDDLHPPRNLKRFAKSCLVPGGWRVAYVLKGQQP